MRSPTQASYICPSCGEQIVVPIDPTAGPSQSYLEDCPVCCRPNLLRLEIDHDGQVHLTSQSDSSH